MHSRFSSQFTLDQWNELYDSMKDKTFDEMEEFFIENLVWGGNFQDAIEFISKTDKTILTSYNESDDIDEIYKSDCSYDHYSFNPKWRGGCKKYKPIIDYPSMSEQEYYDILEPRFIGDYSSDSDVKWARDMLVSTYPMKIRDDVMNNQNYERALMRIRLKILNRDKNVLKRLLRSAYPSQYDNFLFLTLPDGKEIPIDWESSMIVQMLWDNEIPTSGVITIDGMNNIIIGNTDEISDDIYTKLSMFNKKSKQHLKLEKNDEFVTIMYNPRDTRKIYKDLGLSYIPKEKTIMGLLPDIV